MSDDRAKPPGFSGLDEIPEILRQFQRSSRRALPMMILGLLATVAAAGIGIYYIVNLSSDLAETRDQLRRTTTELDRANANLRSAGVALERARAVVPQGERREIDAALSEVQQSATNLETASASLQQATDRLPETGTEAGEQTWFAVVGSYGIDDAGLGLARDQLRRQGGSRCLEIRRTRIVSNNYAVVLGGPGDRETARANVALARQLAPDAYVQLNREWELVARSPGCGESPAAAAN